VSQNASSELRVFYEGKRANTPSKLRGIFDIASPSARKIPSILTGHSQSLYAKLTSRERKLPVFFGGRRLAVKYEVYRGKIAKKEMQIHDG